MEYPICPLTPPPPSPPLILSEILVICIARRLHIFLPFIFLFVGFERCEIGAEYTSFLAIYSELSEIFSDWG